MPLGGDEINSGYKGYGLAMAAELFCGLMSGSNYANHIRHWTSNNEVANLGQCFVAINPECFAPGLSERLKVKLDVVYFDKHSSNGRTLKLVKILYCYFQTFLFILDHFW